MALRDPALYCPPFMDPTPFGKYLLVERIVQGDKAELFRAVLRGLAGFEKTVAIKRFLPSLSGDSRFVSRFLCEARRVAGMTHVNIAGLCDFGVVEGSCYLAMELVEGVDLGRLLDSARVRGEPLGVGEAAFIVAEAARGLAFAHAWSERGRPLGIVHRGVSPGNLLVSYAGEVKLSDFVPGGAIAGRGRRDIETSSGARADKLRYWSPEQLAGEPLDGRSDVFALGMVLRDALTGSPPYLGADPLADPHEQPRADLPPSPAKIIRPLRLPALPPDLDRIVGKSTARDREARYERAADLARDLTLWLGEQAPWFRREDLGALVERLVPRRALSEGEDAIDDGDHSAEAKVFDRKPAAPQPEPTAGIASVAAVHAARARRPARFALAALALVGSAGVAIWARNSLFFPVIDASDYPAKANNRAPAFGKGALPPGLARPVAATDRTLVSEGVTRRQRLAAIAATPRAEVTRLGVATSPEYRAVMSAVDGALCATPPGRDEPQFPADVEAPLRRLQLTAEATALARYVIAFGELPADVSGALSSLVGKHPAFVPGPEGYSMAALASLIDPASPRFALELVRQQGALGRFRDPAAPSVTRDNSAATARSALCERKAAVARLVRLAPDEPLARALDRYVKATPKGVSVDDRGLRFTVTGAERDRASATLVMEMKVTNPSGVTFPVRLAETRLAGLVAPPNLEPDLPDLPAASWRTVRLTFTAVDEIRADGAVLVVRPGLEFQAYSEVLR